MVRALAVGLLLVVGCVENEAMRRERDEAQQAMRREKDEREKIEARRRREEAEARYCLAGEYPPWLAAEGLRQAQREDREIEGTAPMAVEHLVQRRTLYRDACNNTRRAQSLPPL
jgi:hypothetical protein